MSKVARKPEGYRYVQGYLTKNGEYRCRLYEKRDGKARLVGVARTFEEYADFLGLKDPLRKFERQFWK